MIHVLNKPSTLIGTGFILRLILCIFATFEYLELQFAGTSFGRGVPFFMNLTEVLRFLYLLNNYFYLFK